MAIDLAEFEGLKILIIKCTDGTIITHFLADQNYTEEALGMTLAEYAEAVSTAHEPNKEYSSFVLELSQDIEQFSQDGGDLSKIDIVSGEIQYPSI